MASLNGEPILCGQHTGGDVTLRIFGDEFYARYETLDGYTVVYDTNVGRYCYVQVADGSFLSTGVHSGKPAPTGIRRHLKESPEVRNDKFGVRYQQIRPREGIPSFGGARTLGRDNGLLDGRKLHNGNIRGLTILVDFDDLSANISNADVEKMCNGDGYSRNGNFCSVKEYFKLVSSGKLTYTNTVVGPVKLSKRRSHYIDNLLVEEVMDAVVDDLGIDLRAFDSRGQGIVDAINILYAGGSQYSGELWPHNSFKTLHYSGVRTHYYLLTGLGEEPADLRIGTLCHENGHLLCRFPDMYDYGERDGDHEKSQGIGRYCLMGSGNHLNDRRTPSPVCGYLRELAGWADNIVVLNNIGAGVQQARHGDYNTVMKYETDKSNEYFVVENRSRTGLDSHLPSSGLAVYHCDTLGSNEWQGGTRNKHYQCALLQADGHLDLENNRNAGDSGDLFADVSPIALSHDTQPSSRQWDGTDSEFSIAQVGPAGGIIDFSVGALLSTRTQGQSFPNLLIRDNDARGVDDVISISAKGSASTITVEVEIIHTWVGDLRVTLVAPDGTEAILHNRTGSSDDDVVRTYRSADGEPLNALEGVPIEGDWTLHISDNEDRDVGRLLHWSLELDFVQSGGSSDGSASPGLAIPDRNASGVVSTIVLTGTGNVSDISVSVDIDHSYIGDLEIDLVSPGGAPSRLHNRTGRGANDIKRSYDITTTPELQNMIGEAVHGDWTLRVRDLAAADVGTLKQWSIHVSL